MELLVSTSIMAFFVIIFWIFLGKRAKKSTRRNGFWILFCMGFSFLSIALLDEMTLSISQKMTNGNPGYILWIPTAIMLEFLLYLLKETVSNLAKEFSLSSRRILLTGSLCILTVSGIYQCFTVVTHVKKALENNVLDTAHMNGVFFTYSILITIVSAGIAWGCFHSQKFVHEKK